MQRICDVEVFEPNAPDLVLDLLEANDAPLSAQQLCRAGMLLGHHEGTVRVALTRLLAGGKIARESRGFYTLDSHGLPLATALTDWCTEASSEVAWRHNWVAVHDATLTRADKAQWRRHQLALSLRGFARFQPGLYLRPCNRSGGVEGERERLLELGLAPEAVVFLLSGFETRDRSVACALWPVKALHAQYEALHLALTRHLTLLPDLPIEQALRESLLLGRAAIAALVRDPMLPAALMTHDARDALAVQARRYRMHGRVLWSAWCERPIGESFERPNITQIVAR